MKYPPKNLQFVHTRGDFSICEVSRRPIKRFENGRFPTGNYEPVRYERNETAQLPEQLFQELFFFAAGEAIKSNDWQYYYMRMDREENVAENNNNQPYRESEGLVKHYTEYGMDFYQDLNSNRSRQPFTECKPFKSNF